MEPPAITVNGDYIRALRDARGYTNLAFAAEVGTSASTMSRIELGRRQPTPDLRRRIATTLGVPLAALSSPAAFQRAYSEVVDTVAA